MAKENRQRHQLWSFIAGVAEHQALIASALLFILALVNAHGDVGRLLVNAHHHAAGISIEADTGFVIADFAQRAANDVVRVDHTFAGDFTGDHDLASGAQSLTSHPAFRILRQESIKDRVANLVRHLIGVTHRNGFGSEE